MYGENGNSVRAATATTSDVAQFGEDGFSKALVTYANDLDQNVTFTLQGRNLGDTTWQTIGADIVAASGVGNRSLTVPWGQLRVSALPAGIPTTGSMQAILTRVEGA